MPIIRKKRCWCCHFLYLILISGVLVAAAFAFHSRYRIAIDPQNNKCLPNFTFYLIDLQDKALDRGNLYAFEAKNMQPFYADGTRMVKILKGMHGDLVRIESDESLVRILVNGNTEGTGLWHVQRLDRSVEDFMGERSLGENELWMMGESPSSFDSRYWGAASSDQIIGRAYAIF